MLSNPPDLAEHIVVQNTVAFGVVRNCLGQTESFALPGGYAAFIPNFSSASRLLAK